MAGLRREPARDREGASEIRGARQETAIGQLPRPSDLNLKGLDIAPAAIQELLSVDRDLWKKEASDLAGDFAEYGSRTPEALKSELAKLVQRLGA